MFTNSPSHCKNKHSGTLAQTKFTYAKGKAICHTGKTEKRSY